MTNSDGTTQEYTLEGTDEKSVTLGALVYEVSRDDDSPWHESPVFVLAITIFAIFLVGMLLFIFVAYRKR